MGKPTLTPEQVAEIIRLYQEGVSINKLSQRFAVTRGAIRYHVKPDYAEKMRAQMRERMRQQRG